MSRQPLRSEAWFGREGKDGSSIAIGEMPQGHIDTEPYTLSARTTASTGITDEIVAGQQIDPGQVSEPAALAHLGVAHNAAFDHRVLSILPVLLQEPLGLFHGGDRLGAEGFEGGTMTDIALRQI